MVETKGSVTVQELTEYFQASESTIRRDLNVLDKKGTLVKVFGGALKNDSRLTTREEKVSLRMELHRRKSSGSADMPPLSWNRRILSIWTQVRPPAP